MSVSRLTLTPPFRLTGIYRARPEPPGFGICIFEDTLRVLCAQRVGEDGNITEFVPCNLDGGTSSLLWEIDPIPVSPGQAAFCAFQRHDSSFVRQTESHDPPAIIGRRSPGRNLQAEKYRSS